VRSWKHAGRVSPVSVLSALFVLSAVLPPTMASAEDWPAYQRDAARSAVTAEGLEFPLSMVWTYEPTHPPRPAWPQPGKEVHRLDFDYAFQPVVAGGLVLFGSSADDTVRALDAAAGGLKWRFTTGGPIRFAPAAANGRAYVASDDGCVYCLDAASGKLVWRFRAAPSDDQLLGNGRMVSRWPLRSGVLVADGVAYVTAGMWPAHGIYVYALDAETGKVLWCNDGSGAMYINLPHPGSSAFTGVSPQGYLAASKDLLLVPTGRSVPAAYERATGRLAYYRPSASWHSGGAWLTVAGDLFLNPRHPRQLDDEAHVGEAEPRKGDGMLAYKLATGEQDFELPDLPTALVAGETLYGVGAGEVRAIDLAALRRKTSLTRCIRWKAQHPRAYCAALAGNALLVGGAGSVTALDAATGDTLWRAEVDGQVRGLAVADGRLVAATDRGTLVAFEHRRVPAPAAQERERLDWSVGAPDEAPRLAADIVRRAGVSKGYALVLGEAESRLAAALASQTDLHVLSVLRTAEKVAAERERLLSTDLYGTRLVVQSVEKLTRLPYAPYFADLVVVAGDPGELPAEELYRVLRPCGGVLCFAGVPAEAARTLIAAAKVPEAEVRASGDSAMVVRGPLPGAGEWRCSTADTGGTRVGAESRVRLPLDLLWFGGPGPDRMLDRHWGAAAPLAVAGRVFVTGQHHVVAFDAYNGRELWSRELRGAGRPGADWASGNFAADDDALYVAVGPRCHRLDQATGRTLAVYSAPVALTQPADQKDLPPVEVEWPTAWQVFGPIPKDSAPVPRAALKRIPKGLDVAGKSYAPAALDAVEGMLDFTNLYGGYGFKPLRRGQQPGPYPRGEPKTDMVSEQQVAYAFAKIRCPAAGRLTIGAGSDWWMQWFLDGEPLYDTLDEGNSGFPYAITNHVFATDVVAGDHVLAVMVKAGSRGWCLISAGGAKYEPQLQRVAEDVRRGSWGYLAVAGDLLLGTFVEPRAAPETSRALFALGKADGRERWLYTPKDRLFNTGIALAEGRVFLLDGTSRQDAEAAKRRGGLLKPRRSLVALDLAKGSELWRQDGVPPEQTLAVAQGVVAVSAHAAFDAATGNKLWERKARAERIPLIHGDWVIAQPQAFYLRTGEPRVVPHLLTGEPQAWEFPRAYGCGSIAGCRNLLFFRSGTMGFLDMATSGTTTFGAVRPGCAVHMIAACGLVILPESTSGCTCSYNFQTSLALVPAAGTGEHWSAFPGGASAQPLRHLRLNLGAPGDRLDRSDTPWLGFPRPTMPGTCPVPVLFRGSATGWYCRPASTVPIGGTASPWLYTSGYRGSMQLVVDLCSARPLVAASCEKPPVIDGDLGDPCWSKLAPAHFDSNSHLEEPQTRLLACRDAENLYFGLVRKCVSRQGKPLPLVGKPPGKEGPLSREDALEIVLTDAKREVGLHVGLSCGGARFDGLANLAERKGTGRSWNGDWTSAARKGAEGWKAEIAIPLKTLASANVGLDGLQVNVMSQNVSGQGRQRTCLVDPGRLGFDRPQHFVPIVAAPVPVPERSFTVRLHFAEPGDGANLRYFNVFIRKEELGEVARLEGFNIVKEAGGPHRAIVKEFRGVKASEQLEVETCILDTDKKWPSVPDQKQPVLCAIEILAEEK